MATDKKPIPDRVRTEMSRQTSPRRLAGPVCLAFVRLVMFLVVTGACMAGVALLWHTALNDPRFRMDGETLSLAGAIRECPESVEELERIGKRFNGRSLLDPRIIADMESAYGESTWIKRIVRMRRRFPNRIEVEFLLRLPAAQVWADNRYWLIDREATILPVAGARGAFQALPEIVGVTSRVIGTPPASGDRWADEGVVGALGILRAFWGSPLAEVLPVQRVVVNDGTFRNDRAGEAVARRRYEVVGPDGTVVRWGTYNPGDLPGELTCAEKLWHLQDLLRREEALQPGICFDVRTRLPGFSLLD